MRVLSLNQPWASLVFDTFGFDDRPSKGWETRSWLPGRAIIPILRTEGFLIHASAKKPDRVTRCSWPFLTYYPSGYDYPLGCIIGHVTLGELMSTHDWVRKFVRRGFYARTRSEKIEAERWQDEQRLGDYGAGRFAWELKNAYKFPIPIPAKGMLGFWKYNDHFEMPEKNEIQTYLKTFGNHE